MAETAVLTKTSLLNMLDAAVETSGLMAPVKRGRKSFAFDWVDDCSELAFDSVRTILPAKQAVLPARETLLEFSRGPKQSASAVIDTTPFVLFGVHPCDLSALEELDWAFSRRNDVSDPHYAARREAVTIVGVDCMPDEYCFCTSVGTEAVRNGADLFLTPIETGYLAEVVTSKGRALLRESVLGKPSPRELAEADAWRARKATRITRRMDADPADLPDILERRYKSPIWEETARRCYSCGTCTNVCPTCFCFDVDDELELSFSAGLRKRRWDSCQFLDFALVAGPHNFRGERPDRVRHRWFRKFAYLNREYGRPFCTGCGRCTQACTAGIDLTGVLNEVIAEGGREAT